MSNTKRPIIMVKQLILSKLLVKNNHKARQNTEKHQIVKKMLVGASYMVSVLKKGRHKVLHTSLVTCPVGVSQWVALGNIIHEANSKVISLQNLQYGCQ